MDCSWVHPLEVLGLLEYQEPRLDPKQQKRDRFSDPIPPLDPLDYPCYPWMLCSDLLDYPSDGWLAGLTTLTRPHP